MVFLKKVSNVKAFLVFLVFEFVDEPNKQWYQTKGVITKQATAVHCMNSKAIVTLSEQFFNSKVISWISLME